MLSTLILQNQEGLARYNELACPNCGGVIDDKNINNLRCLHCNKIYKIYQLEIIPLKERVPEHQVPLAEDVLKITGEKGFIKMILGCNEEWVIFREADYRFVWDYKLWKRLRRIKKYPSRRLMNKYEYEISVIKNAIPITWYEAYQVILDLFDGVDKSKTPNRALSKNSSKYKSEIRDKEDDPFMDNIVAMVSAFIRWYDSMYDKILSDDVEPEDFDRFQEMLMTGVTDEEIEQLKNWDWISLSFLVPAIEYLLSKSIRPSVSLLKMSMKLNIINDLPSTHPFYDLFHEKPL